MLPSTAKLAIAVTMAALPAIPCGAQSARSLLSGCGAAGTGECAAFAAIDSTARAMIANAESPGLAIGIVRDGQLVFNRGYGQANLETGTPVTTSTVFPIFSITKVFTSAAILQMAERGQLSLDDKLSKFFPDFPRGGEVSIRNLLNHTSGIHDYAAPDFALNMSGATSTALTQYITDQKQPFDFDPGSKWQYSNSNFALLGRIIEKLSGKTYREYMAENVFAKLGLRNTAVDRTIDVVPGRASGYMKDRSSPGHFINGLYQDMSIPYAAGSIRSTVADLASWFIALFGGRVVSAASLRDMMTPARLNDGRLGGDVLANGGSPGDWGYYGLGMETSRWRGHCIRGHGGSFPSFNSMARNYADDGVMIIVFSNTGRAATAMESKIAQILFSDTRSTSGNDKVTPC